MDVTWCQLKHRLVGSKRCLIKSICGLESVCRCKSFNYYNLNENQLAHIWNFLEKHGLYSHNFQSFILKATCPVTVYYQFFFLNFQMKFFWPLCATVHLQGHEFYFFSFPSFKEPRCTRGAWMEWKRTFVCLFLWCVHFLWLWSLFISTPSASVICSDSGSAQLPCSSLTYSSYVTHPYLLRDAGKPGKNPPNQSEISEHYFHSVFSTSTAVWWIIEIVVSVLMMVRNHPGLLSAAGD